MIEHVSTWINSSELNIFLHMCLPVSSEIHVPCTGSADTVVSSEEMRPRVTVWPWRSKSKSVSGGSTWSTSHGRVWKVVNLSSHRTMICNYSGWFWVWCASKLRSCTDWHEAQATHARQVLYMLLSEMSLGISIVVLLCCYSQLFLHELSSESRPPNMWLALCWSMESDATTLICGTKQSPWMIRWFCYQSCIAQATFPILVLSALQ